MSKQLMNEQLDFALTSYYSNEYGNLWVVNEGKIGICEALQPYIPQCRFQDLFAQAKDMIKDYGQSVLIFDKRALQAFHQPSMEWYYVTWKDEVYREAGLKTHVKILPLTPWFHKAVEAGKNEILNNYPDHPTLNALDIHYTDTITEALESEIIRD